ncbi:MAG: ABC transporter ATP-binding protein [Thiohalomonadales bacterium]
MIEIKQLSFEYPGKLALNNVSLTIPQGNITALVGPNGAGKTTLMRCIAALDAPLSGSVHICGVDVSNNPRRVHLLIGYLSDFYGLYADLTVKQSLQYAAMAHSIPAAQLEQAVNYAAQRLQIVDRLSDKVATLSRGLSQRLAIAQAIVHEPKLLILDEPAAGLDPEARHALSELFITLKQQGMTLLVSSHILAELEEYSTSMIILRDGEVIENHKLSPSSTDLINLCIATLEASSELAPILNKQESLEILELKENRCIIRIENNKVKMQQLLKLLLQNKVTIYEFGPEKVNLQDAYLETVTQQKKVNGNVR